MKEIKSLPSKERGLSLGSVKVASLVSSQVTLQSSIRTTTKGLNGSFSRPIVVGPVLTSRVFDRDQRASCFPILFLIASS